MESQAVTRSHGVAWSDTIKTNEYISDGPGGVNERRIFEGGTHEGLVRIL